MVRTSTSAGADTTGPRASGPVWTWGATPITPRRALLAAGLWIALSVLLIGLPWAVWGVVAAAVGLGTRRERLGELTAVSCLITIGVLVVFVERRDAPFPGGGWPTSFNSVHGIGLFAVVAILVGALIADDGQA